MVTALDMFFCHRAILSFCVGDLHSLAATFLISRTHIIDVAICTHSVAALRSTNDSLGTNVYWIIFVDNQLLTIRIKTLTLPSRTFEFESLRSTSKKVSKWKKYITNETS